jgi:hypothetical protein
MKGSLTVCVERLCGGIGKEKAGKLKTPINKT